MTLQKLPANGPLALRDRVIGLGRATRAWASSETGGWIIIGVLAVNAIAVAGAAYLLPRLNAPAPVVRSVSEASAASQQAGLGDLSDFTLAPEAIQDMDFAAARLWNAALPVSAEPIRPAAPLIAPTADIEAYGRALDCLTAAVYYEAASETPQGQAAVAQVVLNRVRHPAYPRTVCGVVFQGAERMTGCQFSFTCDGAMARVPSPAGWARARATASAALNGSVAAAVGMATHYHTDWVAPYWAPRMTKIVQIGAHIFYRWNGAWGLPSSFTGKYSGAEPIVPRMAALSTFATEPPVEILLSADLAISVPADVSPRLAPVVLAQLAHDPSPAEAEDSTAERAPEAHAPSLPVARREVPIMADPLVSPAAQPPRQRQRIATPSNW